VIASARAARAEFYVAIVDVAQVLLVISRVAGEPA